MFSFSYELFSSKTSSRELIELSSEATNYKGEADVWEAMRRFNIWFKANQTASQDDISDMAVHYLYQQHSLKNEFPVNVKVRVPLVRSYEVEGLSELQQTLGRLLGLDLGVNIQKIKLSYTLEFETSDEMERYEP